MDLVEYMLKDVGLRPRAEIRVAIAGLEEMIRNMPDAGSAKDAPVQHFFAPGTYSREITMAEGSVVIGKIHRHAHVNIISKGRCRVLTEAGSEELSAPCTFVSYPGTKRVVYMIEDVVWTTVHANPTNETDVSKLEQDVIATDYADIELEGVLV